MMLGLPLVALLILQGVPLAQALWMSFQHAVLTKPQRDAFIGLENYMDLIVDPDVWAAVWRSLIYMVGTVSGAMLIGFGCALLTRRAFAGVTLARIMMILPWSVPTVAGALVFGIMYDTDFGVINQVLRSIFPDFRNIQWLLDPSTTFASLIIIEIWCQFPIAYIFLLAGLQQLPDELYEAAQMDGANRFQQFAFVTLPQMRYVMAVTALLLSIFAFKSFAVIFLLTGGGPAGRTETLVMQTYNEAFLKYDFGYGSALGITTVLISLAMVIIYFRMTLRHGTASSTS